jgi:hypothetical protein
VRQKFLSVEFVPNALAAADGLEFPEPIFVGRVVEFD